MSMPSDVTPDIDVTPDLTGAMDAAPAPLAKAASRAKERLTAEQFGLAAAAAIAFLGVAILGPALARIGKPKPLSRRVEDKARDVRERAGAAGERAMRTGAKASERARQAAGRGPEAGEETGAASGRRHDLALRESRRRGFRLPQSPPIEGSPMAQDVAAALDALKNAYAKSKAETTQSLFAADPKRFDRFHVAIDGLIFDYSKQRVSAETMALLYDLARAAKLEERRAALFGGEKVNVTEGRSVLHMALRNVTPGKPFRSDGRGRHARRHRRTREDGRLRRGGPKRRDHRLERRALHRRRQHRDRRLRPWAGDGGARAPRPTWRSTSASTSSPMWTVPISATR